MTTTSQNQNTAPNSPNTASPATTSQNPHRVAPGCAAASKACAACKHQRRRCAPQCPLAAYFPVDKPKDFLNVHKLFGVNNVVKILKKVPQHERQNAVKSVVFEANVRAINPVGGCHSLIIDLQKKINLCMSELDVVLKLLDFYKAKFNVYHQIGGCSNQELVKIEMMEQFSRIRAHEESSSQVTDRQYQETDTIGIVQQFLHESNESRGDEVLKDDDTTKLR